MVWEASGIWDTFGIQKGESAKLEPVKVLTPCKQRGSILWMVWNPCGMADIWKPRETKLCIIISTEDLTPDPAGAETRVLWFKEIKT